MPCTQTRTWPSFMTDSKIGVADACRLQATKPSCQHTTGRDTLQCQAASSRLAEICWHTPSAPAGAQSSQPVTCCRRFGGSWAGWQPKSFRLRRTTKLDPCGKQGFVDCPGTQKCSNAWSPILTAGAQSMHKVCVRHL